MDYTRLAGSIDVERLSLSKVALIGTGASRDLACDLVRSGLMKIELYDPDRVEQVNLARQGFLACDVGQTKVSATARALQAINPAVVVRTSTDDITTFSDEELGERFQDVDLLILATDRFAAQAKGNELALRLGIPAIWIGLYARGLGGEVIFWHPALDPCYRCLCAKRYDSHAQANPAALDPPSDGATIFDVRLLDSIAGQLAIGLLTGGSDTRYGRLIDELGDRNFLQIKIDPACRIGSRDVVRELLGVRADNETWFAWNTIVRHDPDRGQLPCDDCRRFRGHAFVHQEGRWRRIKRAPQESMEEIRSWNS